MKVIFYPLKKRNPDGIPTNREYDYLLGLWAREFVKPYATKRVWVLRMHFGTSCGTLLGAFPNKKIVRKAVGTLNRKGRFTNAGNQKFSLTATQVAIWA